ncbi:MAG: aspartyl-phosphate phosphatase Spo0E family protein [Clostridia bacterium]
MNAKKQKLKQEISNMQYKLNELVKTERSFSNKTLLLSQKLDTLIVKYYRVIEKE